MMIPLAIAARIRAAPRWQPQSLLMLPSSPTHASLTILAALHFASLLADTVVATTGAVTVQAAAVAVPAAVAAGVGFSDAAPLAGTSCLANGKT